MPLILLIIGIFLIVYNYRAIKREGETKELDSSSVSFQSALQDSMEELSDYKMEIGLLRKDIAESLTELQEEIFDIKKDIHLLKNMDYHRLKNTDYHLLKKNKDHRLKNNGKIYENKEGLENNYHINENNIDLNINQIDNKSEDIKEEVNSKSIDYKTDNIMILESETNDGIISEINFSEKVDSDKTASIRKLLSEGLTEEEICHELSVSKGEVLLVKGLFKK